MGHVTCKGEIRSAYKYRTLIRKPEGKKPPFKNI
jgi:hypothetical protein